jgi:predicted outer membrane repeat protein
MLEDRTVPSTYTVNLAGDAGTGTGLTGDIRYCINQATIANDNSTITFDTQGAGSTITLKNGELPISVNMTVQGPGAARLTVSGDQASRVFDITSTSAAVTISGMTISGGKAADNGGGILNNGTLTVSDCTISGNSAATEGGGILNDGNLTVSGRTFSGNSAAIGGGIGNGTNATATIAVSDSTFSGNSATDSGGGIYNAATGTVTLTNVTVAANRAGNGSGGFATTAGAPVLHNTLIAGNFLGMGSTPADVSGALDAASDHSLIGDGTGMSGITDGSHGNQVGVNPLLAPLGDYGGPTQTVALLPGSPAIDQGNDAYGGTTDQRQVARVGAPDIGAFESQGFTVAVTGGDNQTATINTAFAQPLAVTVTAKAANEPVAGGAIAFAAPTSGSSAVLSATTASLDAAGHASITASANGIAGSYQVTVSAAGVAAKAAFNLSNTAPQALVPDTVGVFDPATGAWYLRYDNSPGAPNIQPFAYGGPGYIGVHGDWDGNGTSTIGVVDVTGQSDANFAVWYLKNSNAPGNPDIKPFAYGMRSWIPVVGDWAGSGHTGIGVFDPTTATFYLRNSDSPGAPDFVIHYGGTGWVPVVGDWDGNGTTTVGVVDPKTETWYLRNSNSPGAPDITPFAYGAPGWTPVAGNWNAGGSTGIGVFDPSNAKWYLRDSASLGAPDVTPFAYGGANWQPVPGNYTPLAVLSAATGQTPPSAPVTLLTNAQLQTEVAGALSRLTDAGVDAAVIKALQAAKFQVSPLPNGTLTVTQVSNGTVLVNPNAAGYGWFIDPTPLQDEEFSRNTNGAQVAVTSGPAAGRMDLLTAVLHDLGTLAGISDVNPQRFPDDVMANILPTGIRRTDALDAVFANPTT